MYWPNHFFWDGFFHVLWTMEKRYISAAIRCWKTYTPLPLGTSSISSAVYPNTFKASWEKNDGGTKHQTDRWISSWKIFSQNEFSWGSIPKDHFKPRVDIISECIITIHQSFAQPCKSRSDRSPVVSFWSLRNRWNLPAVNWQHRSPTWKVLIYIYIIYMTLKQPPSWLLTFSWGIWPF